MKDSTRIKKILHTLTSLYPDVETQLVHKTPFQLLISTILSAQFTDRQVNSVTPMLFKKYSSPSKLAKAKLNEIERIIYSTGFYKNKAKHLKKLPSAMDSLFEGNIPDNIEIGRAHV